MLLKFSIEILLMWVVFLFPDFVVEAFKCLSFINSNTVHLLHWSSKAACRVVRLIGVFGGSFSCLFGCSWSGISLVARTRLQIGVLQ